MKGCPERKKKCLKLRTIGPKLNMMVYTSFTYLLPWTYQFLPQLDSNRPCTSGFWLAFLVKWLKSAAAYECRWSATIRYGCQIRPLSLFTYLLSCTYVLPQLDSVYEWIWTCFFGKSVEIGCLERRWSATIHSECQIKPWSLWLCSEWNMNARAL